MEESGMPKEDIISELIQRPFLKNLTTKIFSYLDLRSLDHCIRVSTNWNSAIKQLSNNILSEIDWIDKGFTANCRPLRNI
jgi:hypothetical protein